MDLTALNWLDYVLLLILVGSVVSSFLNGFTREIIGLVSTIAAIVLGLWFYGLAGAFLLPFVSAPAVANFCGFLIVFIGVQLLGSLLAWVVRRIVKGAKLSFLDRLLGAAFGFARGALIAMALVMAVLAFAPGARSAEAPESVVQSKIAPYVMDAAHAVTRIAPRELKDDFNARYQQARKLIKSAANDALKHVPRLE
ncbi:MAG: CvpA family protein [Bryobacteraceae bacterium]